MNEYKPCPMCGEEQSMSIAYTVRAPRTTLYSVECACGVSGPTCLSESGAVAQWDLLASRAGTDCAKAIASGAVEAAKSHGELDASLYERLATMAEPADSGLSPDDCWSCGEGAGHVLADCPDAAKAAP